MRESRFLNVTKPLAGFTDLVGRDARELRYLESQFSMLFARWAYEEIRVPIVERASSFSEEVIGGSPWPEWDKRGVFYLQLQSYHEQYADLPDQEPALLVPEGTISVSRWLADVYRSPEATWPRKIFYVMPCFRNELISKLSPTKGRQFHQAGIEILGSNHLGADLEVLMIAHRGFLDIGVDPAQVLVRIGSVELFNAVCHDTGMGETDILVVKDLMDTIAESRAGKQPERLEPSIARVFEILDGYRPSDALIRAWERMVRSSANALGKDFVADVGYAKVVEEMNRLAAAARSCGIRCVIDPSVVRSHEYYSGIVYEIDVQLSGTPPLVEVAGGGRYNKLIGKFLDGDDAELSVPAVGFAYGMERMATILRGLVGAGGAARRAVITEHHLGPDSVDVVLATDDLLDAAAWTHAARLRETAGRVDVYVGDDRSDAAVHAYAAKRGAEVVRT